jgi:hypothetical protein
MITPPPYTLTHESVTVILEGVPHTVQKGTTQYNGLRDAIFREDWTALGKHLSQTASLQQWLGDQFTVADDGKKICYQGQPLPESIQTRIWAMANNHENPTPLLCFYERLAKNPSYRSVEQLFAFLQHSHIPLEPDGRFLAYKGITQDFKDVHTGEIDNVPGTVNKMARNLVSDDPRTACHYGYHVGALRYATSFAPSSGHVVVCRVDPEHVVCVPYDSSQEKMRVCEYEVVGHWNGQPLSSTVQTVDVERSPDWNDDDDNDDDNDDIEDDEDVVVPAVDAADDEDDEEDDEEEDLRVLSTAEREQKAKAKQPKVQPKPATSKATKFDRLDGRGLLDQSIEDLRKYASGVLKIIGASKLPGGKAALVTKILRVRRK